MFNFFGSTIEEDIKHSLIRNAYSQNTSNTKNLILKHRINVTNNNLVDECEQNLLHIAAKTKNYELANYLIANGINKNKKNIFNETPFDIAMKNGDQKMLEILFDQESNLRFKTQNAILNGKVSDLESNNVKLINANKELTMRNSSLHIMLDEEKKSNKRKADDYSLYQFENKKLKVENAQLKSDNTSLTETVKTLRESMKKK